MRGPATPATLRRVCANTPAWGGEHEFDSIAIREPDGLGIANDFDWPRFQQMPNRRAQMPATAAVPEQVLVTGSLIHGAAAVGVPVTNLGIQDFTETGNVLIGDLFRTIPQANVAPGPSAVNSGGHQERETRVNIRGLDGTGPRSLLMIDGVRFPPQADGLCAIDPSDYSRTCARSRGHSRRWRFGHLWFGRDRRRDQCDFEAQL